MSIIQKLKKIKLHIQKSDEDSEYKSEWEYEIIDIITQIEKLPAFTKSKNFKNASEKIRSIVISYKVGNPDYSPGQIIMYIDTIIKELETVKSGIESDGKPRS